MNNKPKTKLLTISLLCCGRPETTERCLKSLMPIRKAIDSELQVVDTGCSKETREIIEKYADEIFEFQWCNDFAKARNFQLDQANGKMFLYIDDDEFFLDTKYIIEFFKQPNCTSYNIGGYAQRNYLDMEAKEYQDVDVMRMCKVTPETRFVGKIHEYIEPAYGNAMIMDAQAGHFGYVYASEEDNVRHSMRNIPLLKEMQQEDPENFRWPYQLAQEYKAIHYNEELLQLCKDNFERTRKYDDNEHLSYRGSFAAGMCLALNQLDRFDEIIQFYNEQKKKPEIMELPLARLAFYAATGFFTKNEAAECKDACNYYLQVYKKIGNDRGQMFLQGGLFTNDTFDETKMNMVYCFLMTIGMEENDFSVLSHYYRKITWDSKVVRLNRGFLVMLVSKAAELGHKRELSDVLNKFFTNIGFRNVLQNTINGMAPNYGAEELENIKNAFKGTAGEKEMDLFMDIRIMEQQFSEIKEWSSFNDLLQNLLVYSEATIKWQELHDTVDDDTTKEKQLDATALLGVRLQKFAEFNEINVPGSLELLKKMFGVRLKMNETIGELSRLYGEQQKIIAAKKNNPAKYQEMYQLEEQLLQQIAELDSAGKTDEALAIYQQLTGILQQSFGVDTLH